MSKKVLLIDGHSILNRAFYGVPMLTNSQGLHTNAVYGFLNIILKILDEESADYLAVAFDVSAPTFRHQMFAEYKGTRKAMPEELREQVPVMKDVLHCMNIPTLECNGYEADDILGTLARRCEAEGYDVAVLSGDRDLLQLATDKIKIRIPKTKKGQTEIEDYYAADVMETYQVTPSEFIDVKALMGDASDNIPGVPGIGEKTATKIISQYKNIETAYAHTDELKPKKASENLKAFYEQAQFSKTLATIKTDCELFFDIQAAAVGDMFNPASYDMFKQLRFKNLLKRFEEGEQVDENTALNVSVITDFSEAEQIFSNVTTETEIGVYYLEDDETAGVAVSFGKDRTCYIAAGGLMTAEYLRSKTEAAIKRAKRAVFMNLKPQLDHLSLENDSPAVDAGIAAYLLNPVKSTYAYDDLARDYLDMTLLSETDFIKKLTPAKAMTSDPEHALQFAGYMAWVPLAVYPVLLGKLKETEMLSLFETIEMPLIYTLWDMQQAGIRVERDELAEYGGQLSTRILLLEQEIYKLSDEEFNINSPKQLGVILFEKMNLPFGKKTKTGYSTSADVLEKLRSVDPIVGLILEYRQLTKLKSTYADGLAAFIRKTDERIHGTFNQTITATGRISSTEPNLQNIPVRMELGRLIRKVFVPEEGYVFVNADYSQIELRVLAHMAGDEHLIQAYKEAQDIHKTTAAKVFHVPLDEVTPELRRNAKAVNFGIVYGISSFGLSQDLSITRKEAEGYISQYFETYPKVKAFLDHAVAMAKEKGYVTTMFNRRRPVPEIASANFMQRQFGERIAMNSPIQGTAADIIKIAMNRVNDRLKRQQMKSRLILQIHDELLIETHQDEIEDVKLILSEEMQHAAELAVPLEVDMNVGHSWYELK